MDPSSSMLHPYWLVYLETRNYLQFGSKSKRTKRHLTLTEGVDNLSLRRACRILSTTSRASRRCSSWKSWTSRTTRSEICTVFLPEAVQAMMFFALHAKSAVPGPYVWVWREDDGFESAQTKSVHDDDLALLPSYECGQSKKVRSIPFLPFPHGFDALSSRWNKNETLQSVFGVVLGSFQHPLLRISRTICLFNSQL